MNRVSAAKATALAAIILAASLSLTACSDTSAGGPLLTPSPTGSQPESSNSAEPEPSESSSVKPAPKPSSSTSATPAQQSTLAADLKYLIEEEKLAHDVYSALYEIWGSRVFANILESETSHQDQVLAIMNSYDVADPRLSAEGEFVNSELQEVYDQLIAKGSKSLTDAFEVGVVIEELDIKDLTEMVQGVSQSDVVAMMQRLISASENHLAAFQRQL